MAERPRTSRARQASMPRPRESGARRPAIPPQDTPLLGGFAQPDQRLLLQQVVTAADEWIERDAHDDQSNLVRLALNFLAEIASMTMT